MARANRTKRRYGSEPESVTTGGYSRSGASQSGTNVSSTGLSNMKLETLGPVVNDLKVTDPLLGYTYRNNETFTENFDKLEVVQVHKYLSLGGMYGHKNNPSANVSYSAIDNVSASFWEDVYTLLHEMAQKRDGYKATTETLTDPTNVMFRDELVITLKINVRVLWTLYHAALANEGLRSMVGFAGRRSRIQRALEASNTIIYPAAFDKIIDYWSEVYSPYLGGPVIYNLFFPANIQAGASLDPGTSVATVFAAVPDLTTTASVDALLNDIECGIAVVTRYDLDVAADATDLRLINSIYAMMGIPTPQTGVKGLTVNPQKFVEQFKEGGWIFEDSGGSRSCYWPDIRGSADSLIHVYRKEMDELDAIGAKGWYAADADDDDTPGFTGTAADLTLYGMVFPSTYLSASWFNFLPIVRYYTREDGWSDTVGAMDVTAAAGCQAYIWSVPHVTCHPEAWRFIMSEEAEEAYAFRFALTDNNSGFQRPFDHWGQAYRKWIHNAYGIPFIT